jgi:hypothetical protein
MMRLEDARMLRDPNPPPPVVLVPATQDRPQIVGPPAPSDLVRLLGASSLVPRTLRLDALELRDAGGGRSLRQPAREEVVARVPAGDVDDVPAQAELLDVLEEDDVHLDQGATYGSSAISRARFTAAATWSWCRRQAPVMRRDRIFPFSEM